MSRSSILVGAVCFAVLLRVSLPAFARKAEFRARGEARRGAVFTANPELFLRDVYANLLMVRRCYEARQGSLAIFINDAELARANGEARATSERIKAFAPVRDELAWRFANELIAHLSQNRPNCSGSLAYLDRSYGSPSDEQ